ncbi:MAG: alpha-1,4-glucan--maltose-1-phosphate maltosyltransferase [Candidatus Dadabacteria bacterium]|nr:alpha-1,4-glucan--maltose-1-phosphate maltosyltransferase [Candidatus Dadabacteria bacterium]
MMHEGRKRIIIENVKPEIDCGHFPVKRVVGEKVLVEADILTDGHDSVSARLLYKEEEEMNWKEIPMKFMENDRWRAEFIVKKIGIYYYTLEGWVDHFRTWQKGIKKKFDADQEIKFDLLIGIQQIEEGSKRASGRDKRKLMEFSNLLKEADIEKALSVALDEELTELMDKYPDRRFATSYGRDLAALVDREKALFSTWYECFPRSCSPEPGKHGTFKDCERLLPEIERMGFDILYLPPIHPIGKANRKGKNNLPQANLDDIGSPWAIGGEEGGHKAIHPKLGSFEDFERLVNKAKGYGIDIAIDLAFQCSPNHPYVKEHPEWFRWRPDGTVQYAENPPKKYEDVLPLNFETDNRQELWEELKSIVVFWIEKGVRIFRVDNPHTKPFSFWEWLIKEIKGKYPDIIFLSEAFTRPKVMYNLAKLGFTQSYTYFTWRNTKKEFTGYLTELTQTEVGEYFRPNFWPNTPDILPEHLQFGGRPAFMMRLVLAATLSSSYGIYGPAFELCVSEALPGKEEYMNSEKYEIKEWDLEQPGNLRDFIARVNKIRKENPALQMTRNLKFYEVDNEYLLFYGKSTEDLSNIIFVVLNLDPYHTQSGWVRVPINELGIDPTQPYLVHDLLSEDKYIWHGERNYIELNPQILPAHILRVKKRLKRETDFDYFM